MAHLTHETFDILTNTSRPNSKAYINHIFRDFVELSGDRLFGDDLSLIGGIGFLNYTPVTVIGQLRGNSMEDQKQYNFSMSYPEGYRKSLRLIEQAEKFHRPIICFIDTIGAYPGLDAEDRGQASAIAHHIRKMVSCKTPIISIVIGYGASGGALALCVADRLAMLENSVLGVISPKAYAQILWKDSRRYTDAINLLKMTAYDLSAQGVIDDIIPEPIGGAQTNFADMSERIKAYIVNELRQLRCINKNKLVRQRQKRYDDMRELYGRGINK